MFIVLIISKILKIKLYRLFDHYTFNINLTSLSYFLNEATGLDEASVGFLHFEKSHIYGKRRFGENIKFMGEMRFRDVRIENIWKWI